jgi:DMSO/TMAO reductase YedYZ molybdopterin-dependent catalytic subunit
MNKFTQRIVTAGASVALASGAFLAAAGPASAAAYGAEGHPAAAVGVKADTVALGQREARDPMYYQWVADQLELFGNGLGERGHSQLDPRYSPWISDQLMTFSGHDGLGHDGLGHHHIDHDRLQAER